MIRTFSIHCKYDGREIERVDVDVEPTASLDEAAAEARAEYEAIVRSGAAAPHEADAVIASIGRVEWVQPRSTIDLPSSRSIA